MRWSLVVPVVVAAVALAIDFSLKPHFTSHKEGYVVLSGASTGIGFDAALHLAEAGYTVLAGVRSDKAIAEVKAAAQQRGVEERVIPVILDVTNDEHIAAVRQQVDELVAKTKLPFVAVVNNAGIAGNNPVEHLDRAAILRVYEVNVFGVYALTKAFLPLIRESKGRIVSVSSVGGTLSHACFQPYTGTKFALEAINDSLRRELYPVGVSVSLINPACTKSAIFGKDVVSEPTKDDPSNPYNEVLKSVVRANDKCAETAEDPATTSSPAILDAIRSPHPKTRYFTASFDGTPAWVIATMAKILPDTWADGLFRAVAP